MEFSEVVRIFMKAAIWHGFKDVRIREVSRPAASSGHVIVKVCYAGVCGTDRHEYAGPVFIPVSQPHRLTGKTFPLILGHEFSGVISEIGENVSGWSIGDRVTANGTLSCGKCESCIHGNYNVCEKLGFLGVSRDGAFAEYVEVEAARLFSIPPAVSLKEAVLAEPLACGIHAAKQLGDLDGLDVAVVGSGIIGLSAFFAAKRHGARDVLVAGVGKERRELLEKYGALYFDINDGDIAKFVSEQSVGRMFDIVYECVGTQEALDSCISILKPRGRLMIMGVYERPPIFRMNDFQEGERRLLTSQAHTDEISEVLRYIGENEINVRELITREISLDNLVVDGFEELLANGMHHIKIIINISEQEEI
jgi:(R,R)-butanediol dehydrogenase/meso-butanediol dehydrogenase/diacetyl reductase